MITSKLTPVATVSFKTETRPAEKLRALHHKQIQIAYEMCNMTDFKPSQLTESSGKLVTKHRLSELNRQTVLQLVVCTESKNRAESQSL